MTCEGRLLFESITWNLGPEIGCGKDEKRDLASLQLGERDWYEGEYSHKRRSSLLFFSVLEKGRVESRTRSLLSLPFTVVTDGTLDSRGSSTFYFRSRSLI